MNTNTHLSVVGRRGRGLGNFRSKAVAVVVGTIVAVSAATVASAHEPYEPTEHAECQPWDDCGFYPDPPADGDTPGP